MGRLLVGITILGLLVLCAMALSSLASAAFPPCHIERHEEDGDIVRSSKVLREFRKLFPCPVTNLTTGPCPGHVIDHIVPLCACGPDTVENLQWQGKEESLLKDKDEKKICRWLR